MPSGTNRRCSLHPLPAEAFPPAGFSFLLSQFPLFPSLSSVRSLDDALRLRPAAQHPLVNFGHTLANWPPGIPLFDELAATQAHFAPLRIGRTRGFPQD